MLLPTFSSIFTYSKLSNFDHLVYIPDIGSIKVLYDPIKDIIFYDTTESLFESDARRILTSYRKKIQGL